MNKIQYKALLSFLTIIAGIVFLIPNITQAQFYRGLQTDFGKNRVQYQQFDWNFYRFEKFDTYFYLGGQDLAAFVGQTAGDEIDELEKLFDYSTSGRIEFMIYNKLSDLKQSNIGLSNESDDYNAGGVTKIVGNKVLLYFDGDHKHFKEQLRYGVAQVIFNQLMYGGNIRDRLQSSVLLSLPEWYTQGLISYVSTGWTVQDDNRMRDGVIDGRYSKFKNFISEDQEFAGHSVWNYVFETYGSASVANMLYMTRINRNIESGFQFVLGLSLKSMNNNWIKYYEKKYKDIDNNKDIPKGQITVRKTKSKFRYNNISISPDAKSLVYVTNQIGKYKIWLYDLKTHKKKCIDKGGYKSLVQEIDYSFPVVEWHPSGKQITIFKEHKGKVLMDFYDVKKGKSSENNFFYFEKVLDVAYSDDGENILLSGTRRGQSDIFVYNIRTRTNEQITNDFFDDLHPSFTLNNRFILFSSNRNNDTLGVQTQKVLPEKSNFDIFLYDFKTKSKTLKRLTSTVTADELYPIQTDSVAFSYLSNRNGIYNRYVSTLDSAISYIDTTAHYRYIIKNYEQSNYSRNIEQHSVNSVKSHYAQLFFQNGKQNIYINPVPETRLAEELRVLKPSEIIKYTPVKETAQKEEEIIKTKSKKDTGVDSAKIDINNYLFQSEFEEEVAVKTKTDSTKKSSEATGLLSSLISSENEGDTLPFRLPKQRAYETSFSTQYFVAQLSNSALSESYQAFDGSPNFFEPGVNGFVKIGMVDLFDDYRLTGGFKPSFNLNSNEYIAYFENYRKRLDYKLTFYRAARELSQDSLNHFKETYTHEVKVKLIWPFNDLSSIRVSYGYRNDRVVTLSTETQALLIPNSSSNYFTNKIEYVYDNTMNTGLNLRNGTRLKLFGEVMNEVEEQFNVYVFGVDMRNYTKVHRQIVWANRFAASISQGDRKLIYYLGAMDNTFVPSNNFDESIKIDVAQDYAFQTIATNMRGFLQNIRNGNSFAVINSELRVPIFEYLFNRPLRSDFLRSMQVTTFVDVGTAWTGSSPFSDDNSLNTDILNTPPLTVTLKKQIEPIVAGYGFGLRSRVFGYYIKGDWAWGIEDSAVRDLVFYLSLGLDF